MINGRHPVDIRLGELMRQRRKHLGLTKSGLAAQLALTKDDIRKYERGEIPFRADMLAVLPIALSVNSRSSRSFSGRICRTAS
jgi:transcriptional regulator with XRE-family HTH domain